jgi:hypothetical protein
MLGKTNGGARRCNRHRLLSLVEGQRELRIALGIVRSVASTVKHVVCEIQCVPGIDTAILCLSSMPFFHKRSDMKYFEAR